MFSSVLVSVPVPISGQVSVRVFSVPDSVGEFVELSLSSFFFSFLFACASLVCLLLSVI